MTPTAYERVVDRMRAEGLVVKERSHGRASAQAPGHSAADSSVTLTDIGGMVLIHSHSDPTEDVMDALGFTKADLFDNPRGSDYRYSDGRIVRRTPDKRFFQEGNKTGKALFRVERVPTTSGPVFVAEGEKDVLALEAIGATAVCNAGGAGKAHLFQWDALAGRDVVIIADRDRPGLKHTYQLALKLTGVAKSIRTVYAKIGKDAADHVAAGHGVDEFVEFDVKVERLVLALNTAAEKARTADSDVALDFAYRQLDELTPDAEEESPARLRKFGDLLDDWWDWVDAPPRNVRTIPTPWEQLNEAISGGLHAGRSYLFAGRPGSGKSLALTMCAAHAAESGFAGALFSVEMGHMEVTSRILAAGARAEYRQLTRRSVDDDNRSRVAVYASDKSEMPLWVSDQSPITLDEIRNQARILKREHSLDFVAVDYVQLLRPTDSKANRERQIAEISWGMKTMARELDVAVISACQLNRGSAKDKRPPTIAELRESGSLEQDSDVVVLLHHDMSTGQPTGLVELIIGKNRTGSLTQFSLPWRAYWARIG